jgi:Fe-S-cluster containining protein
MVPAPKDDLPEPCASCDATCCRHYAIFVLPADLDRIAEVTGRDPASLADFEIHELARDMPAVFLDGEAGQLILTTDDEGEACALLDPDTLQCTVHSVRPFVCRMYPFAGDPGDPIPIRQREDIYCPGDFPITSAEEEELRQAYLQFWSREIDRYRQQVQRWNHSGAPGGLEAFLAFCRRDG